MHILEAAKILCPNADFNFDGTNLTLANGSLYEGPIPTTAEAQALVDKNAYQKLRSKAYPLIQDLADALVHQQMGDGGAALQTYLNACIAVKNQYPKS